MIPVSICLTTWNRASVLPKTLDSILAQGFEDFELIISDDCSSDNTEDICRSYEVKDARVKYYRNPKNLNMPGNLNSAIQKAKGTYIANLHDGDVYRPDLISKWKFALDEVPTSAFVFNDYETVLKDGTRRIYKMPFGTHVPGKEIALHFFRTVTSCVWGTAMVRSSAYQRAGLLDPSFGFISDVELWLRLSYLWDVAYINEPLINLGPRPTDHPFRHELWRAAFWSFSIYIKYLRKYRIRLGEPIDNYLLSYKSKRRKFFIRQLLSCIKHAQWDRMREGLAIWRDADDPLLRKIGCALGHPNWLPSWYESQLWSLSQLPKDLN